MVKNPLKKKNNLKKYSQLAISDPEIKPFERLIFPTKYVIPKSLSRLAIGQVSFLAKKSKEMIQKTSQCSLVNSRVSTISENKGGRC